MSEEIYVVPKSADIVKFLCWPNSCKDLKVDLVTNTDILKSRDASVFKNNE